MSNQLCEARNAPHGRSLSVGKANPDEVALAALQQVGAAGGDARVAAFDPRAVDRDGALLDQPDRLAGGRRELQPDEEPGEPDEAVARDQRWIRSKRSAARAAAAEPWYCWTRS